MQIVCGNRAGTWTVLLDEDNRFLEADLQGEMKPTFVIQRMSELVQLLRENFELRPPPRAENVALEAGATARFSLVERP